MFNLNKIITQWSKRKSDYYKLLTWSSFEDNIVLHFLFFIFFWATEKSTSPQEPYQHKVRRIPRKRWKAGGQCGGREDRTSSPRVSSTAVVTERLWVVTIYQGWISRHGCSVTGEGLSCQCWRVDICWELLRRAKLSIGKERSSHAVVSWQCMGTWTQCKWTWVQHLLSGLWFIVINSESQSRKTI